MLMIDYIARSGRQGHLSMQRMAWILGVGLLAAGCDEAATTTSASHDTVSSDALSSDASSTTAGVTRGPQKLLLDGDPNGIWWSESRQTLYLADDNNNRILTWQDGSGFGQAFPLLAAPASGSGLGGLVEDWSGKLWVTRFGFGTDGAVLWLAGDGSTGKLANLDVTKRRLGMAIDGAGNVYDSWFIKNGSARIGTVAKLDPAGSETPILTSGLQKPVGLLVKGKYLYVDDQETNAVLRCALPDCKQLENFGNVTTPDLMSDGPGDAVLVASHEGVVVAVRPSVANQVVASGLQEPHGVAYDAKHKRLFIADHDPTSADGETNYLHIVPVD